MELHNAHMRVKKHGIGGVGVSEDVIVRLVEQMTGAPEPTQGQLGMLADDLHNRLESLLKYKVDREWPNLMPRRNYTMDGLRRLAEDQSMRPELNLVNDYVDRARLEEIPISEELREQQVPFEAERYRPTRHLSSQMESDIYRSLKHRPLTKKEKKDIAKLEKQYKAQHPGVKLPKIQELTKPQKVQLELEQPKEIPEIGPVSSTLPPESIRDLTKAIKKLAKSGKEPFDYEGLQKQSKGIAKAYSKFQKETTKPKLTDLEQSLEEYLGPIETKKEKKKGKKLSEEDKRYLRLGLEPVEQYVRPEPMSEERQEMHPIPVEYVDYYNPSTGKYKEEPGIVERFLKYTGLQGEPEETLTPFNMMEASEYHGPAYKSKPLLRSPSGKLRHGPQPEHRPHMKPIPVTYVDYYNPATGKYQPEAHEVYEMEELGSPRSTSSGEEALEDELYQILKEQEQSGEAQGMIMGLPEPREQHTKKKIKAEKIAKLFQTEEEKRQERERERIRQENEEYGEDEPFALPYSQHESSTKKAQGRPRKRRGGMSYEQQMWELNKVPEIDQTRGIRRPVCFTPNLYKPSLNEADLFSPVRALYNHADHVAMYGKGYGNGIDITCGLNAYNPQGPVPAHGQVRPSFRKRRNNKM